jgi:alpha-galactosidase
LIVRTVRLHARPANRMLTAALTFLVVAGAPEAITAAVASRVPRLTTGVLAATPWMGWNTWYSYGTSFNEATIRTVADQLRADGYAAKGYKLVWLDAGWWNGTRRKDGSIQINEKQWPHGMAWIVAYLHAHSLSAGIYTDAGHDGCTGFNQGSYGHIQQDMNTFAAWRFDAVKVDFCGGVLSGLNPATTFRSYSRAIGRNSSRRPIIFVVCNGFAARESWLYAPSIAQGWRTGDDISSVSSNAVWSGSISSTLGTYGSVLANLDADAAHPSVAGPGHWNDPDYLQAGSPTLTATEQQSQFTMWAMLSAPLVIGRDPTRFSSSTRAMLQNAEVIAIDQDARGVQAVKVSDSHGLQVWEKLLEAAGSRAIALLNRTSLPARITVSWKALGLKGRVTIRDLWQHRSLGSYAHRYGVTVPSHATVLLRLQARG